MRGSAGLKVPYSRPLFQWAILTSEVGENDLMCDQGSLVGLLWVQDWKSSGAAVTICGPLVDPKLDFYILILVEHQ